MSATTNSGSCSERERTGRTSLPATQPPASGAGASAIRMQEQRTRRSADRLHAPRRGNSVSWREWSTRASSASSIIARRSSGRALVFEHDAKAACFDCYLGQQYPSLALDQRLRLIRQLGEAMAYAHGKRLYHRGLAPQSISCATRERRPPPSDHQLAGGESWRRNQRRLCRDHRHAPCRGSARGPGPCSTWRPKR